MASGFHSLAKGVGRHFDAAAYGRRVVELEDAFLFVTAAGDGSCLAVLADADADVGLIAYEMTLLVKRVGAHLGTAPGPGCPPEGDDGTPEQDATDVMTDRWFDDDAGPVVRPYAMTRGRTRSSADEARLDLIALVIAERGR